MTNRKIPKWSLTIPAGATRRSPAFSLEGYDCVRGYCKSDQALKIALAVGRLAESGHSADVAAAEAGSASLPYATAEGDIAVTTGAETGAPFQLASDGSPDFGQLVLRNPGGSDATVTVMAGAYARSI